MVIEAARRNGVSDEFLDAARNSPVYKYVVEWKLALPLHVEYRTMPMLFYVPPLLPVMGKTGDQAWDRASNDFFSGLDAARLPVAYLASLFGAGNTDVVRAALKKLMAVRWAKRAQSVGDIAPEVVSRILREAETTPDEVEAIYRMTTTANQYERFVLPPLQREVAVASTCSPEFCKGCTGFAHQPTPAAREEDPR